MEVTNLKEKVEKYCEFSDDGSCIATIRGKKYELSELKLKMLNLVEVEAKKLNKKPEFLKLCWSIKDMEMTDFEELGEGIISKLSLAYQYLTGDLDFLD